MDVVTSPASPPRAVFLDVDGTILAHGSQIAPSTVAAIRSAREAGHLVYLSTGRSAGDIHPRVVEIGFDGAITSGGAYITDAGEVLLARPMPRSDADALVDYFDERGIAYFLQSFVHVYASEGIAPLVDEVLRRRRAAGLAPAEDDEPFIRFTPMAEADLDTITKAVFVSNAIETVGRVRADLGERFHVIPGSMPMPGGTNGEISMIGVNKGSGILGVLEQRGLTAADSVGIGDSWNDAEMFDVVGTSIAMAGAPDELQQRADRVTTGVLDDGVWNAFAELGLV